MKKEIKLGNAAHEKAAKEVLQAAEKLANVMYRCPSFETFETEVRIDEDGVITHYSQEGEFPTHTTEKERIGLMNVMSNAPGSTKIVVKINKNSCIEGGGTLCYQYEQKLDDLCPIVFGYGVRALVIPPSATEEEKTEMCNKMEDTSLPFALTEN